MIFNLPQFRSRGRDSSPCACSVHARNDYSDNRKQTLLLALAILATFLATKTSAGDNTPKVELVQGILNAESVPYNRFFEIHGELSSRGEPVDAVKLRVTKSKSDAFVRESVWWRPDEAAGEFRILVPPLTPIGEEFTFTFEFFVRPPTDGRPIERIVQRSVEQAVERAYVPRGITATQIQTILESRLSADLGFFASEHMVRYASQVDRGGESRLELGENPSPLMGDALETAVIPIGKLVNSRRTLEDEMARNSNDPRIQSLKVTVDQHEREARDALRELLATHYVREAKIQSETRTWASKAQIDKLRTGSVIGFGAAVFDPSDSEDREAKGNAYLGLKYRFALIDRDLPQVYRGWSTRMSATFGVLLSNDLKYRGQDMNDIGGVMPVLGIALDINPDFNLTVGAVFFNQPKANPLADDSDLRVALWLSLDFDADLFNRIREGTQRP